MELSVDIPEHRFGALSVLSDVKFAVRAGEVLCVIGPSGCGKSTLLGIIGGLLEPTRGTIRCSGTLPDGCLNPLTYVFQDFALLPWRTVAGNVAYVLEHHVITAAERAQRVRSTLQRTGLQEFADVFPKQLSGGMRQRVGIARALAVQPAMLLMDEPLSALDAQTRELLMRDFRDLWLREHITTVYVTHNLDEAVRLADRIVVLSRRPGRIKEIISVPIPHGERDKAERSAEVAGITARLWELIREEALIASREVADA
jgi:NitT/TauT family transport system ATP-binding protein